MSSSGTTRYSCVLVTDQNQSYRSHKYPACSFCRNRKTRCDFDVPGQPCRLCRERKKTCDYGGRPTTLGTFHPLAIRASRVWGISACGMDCSRNTPQTKSRLRVPPTIQGLERAISSFRSFDRKQLADFTQVKTSTLRRLILMRMQLSHLRAR